MRVRNAATEDLGTPLKPDFRAGDSSVLCTSIAFQTFRATQALPDDALVRPALTYLLETLDHKTGHWRIIPRSAENSPRAPWWTQTEGDDAFDHFSLNPAAEILGYLYDCQCYVPGNIISLVSDAVTSHLSSLEEIGMHELLCCQRLLQTASLPEPKRELVVRKLSTLVKAAVELDPAQWESYSLRPLQVVDGPNSPFMTGIGTAVAANLDYEIFSQTQAGSWTPTWSWGSDFPEDWEKARIEWSGVITLEKLLVLKRFNRIEGRAQKSRLSPR